jgi:hypothetical protein
MDKLHADALHAMKHIQLKNPQGESKTFKLPSGNNKEGIRKLTHQVEEFVEKQGGTIGQSVRNHRPQSYPLGMKLLK